MSGSGDSLSAKVLSEIRSALGPLFKNSQVRQWPVGIRTQTRSWFFRFPQLRTYYRFSRPVACMHQVDTLAPETLTVLGGDALTPTVQSHHIDFSSVISPQIVAPPCDFPQADKPKAIECRLTQAPVATKSWQVGSMTARIQTIDRAVFARQAASTQGIAFPKRSATAKTVRWEFGPRRARQVSDSCMELPILKKALPLHRFNQSAKDKFRQALADRAQVSPDRIMVKGVYPSIPISLFRSVEPDAHGNLLCHPKPDVVGMTATGLPRLTQDVPMVYLVYGSRLDTREAIHAVIPMPPVRRHSEGGA